jgi:predicted GIY-YIG superfamily endonuclease
MTELRIPTSVYRLKSSEGALLYVGVAGNPGRRFEQHRKEKPWWGDVASVELSHYETREEAMDAETSAIVVEKPLHNIMFNGTAKKGAPVMRQANGDDTPRSIEPGFCVGVALREPIGGMKYYVGEVQAVDDLGIRVSSIQWMIGTFTGFDEWFPWSNVLGLSGIATEAHSLHGWVDMQGDNQERHNKGEVSLR